MSTRLQQLHDEQGQSPWLDNLKRGWITSGELERWVERGVRGITSNPSIFQKAIESSDAYDVQYRELIESGASVESSYWDLVTDDIRRALAILRPVYDASDGVDGFVSVEVDPGLARDTAATIEAARHLHTTIAQPNLYVKIPGTAEGLPAIRQMIAEGRNINVTLLFSVDRYAEVIEAYLSGLEACDGDLSRVSSVASFFVSRVDTETDRRLEAIGSPEALALRGKVAVANAKLAYERFVAAFSGPRWEALAARGARPQRPLWASTSTKNPAYSDVLYVDELIGPGTVNTMPDQTLEAFLDHGTVRRTIDEDLAGAHATMATLAEVGVDLADVARTLEDEGVAAFSKSFEELIATLEGKARTFTR
ncbi:transaldolase [Rhabdothermincola sediminis]|uniref:transaldolase n=1 Tax=Rhabdothermincola sediminis TaxID=2751370 RepID=UPI001AA04324|nr:transaldolase [Rhabdothermincola sediminis]